MLNIMTLEQQLLQEIKERQEKLEKIQRVSPKLQALEALLSECQSVCEEFGMVDLFTNLLGSFTAPTITTSQNQINTTQENANAAVLTDKEVKSIRAELKEFLSYEGQRLNDKTAKELLIKKLEDSSRTDLLTAVNLDDKENFLIEAKKLINLLTLATAEATTEATANSLGEINAITEEVKIPDAFPVNDGVKTLVPNNISPEEIKEETLTINPKDILKSAVVQNTVTSHYGTVEQDGIISNVECEETKDMTPQDKAMWDAMLEIFSAEELSAMATDKETVDGYNSTNGTNLTSLPIAELYEYTMGVGRIE